MPKKILVVGLNDNNETLNRSIVFVDGFADAIELIKNQKFDIVVTAAKLHEEKSGLDILRFIKGQPKVISVCVLHSSTSIKITATQDWHIAPSLAAHFPFGLYWPGSLGDFLDQNLGLKKCA